jgi:hypothetical protein
MYKEIDPNCVVLRAPHRCGSWQSPCHFFGGEYFRVQGLEFLLAVPRCQDGLMYNTGRILDLIPWITALTGHNYLSERSDGGYRRLTHYYPKAEAYTEVLRPIGHKDRMVRVGESERYSFISDEVEARLYNEAAIVRGHNTAYYDARAVAKILPPRPICTGCQRRYKADRWPIEYPEDMPPWRLNMLDNTWWCHRRPCREIWYKWHRTLRHIERREMLEAQESIRNVRRFIKGQKV